MKKLIVAMLILSTLFACILPASATEQPSVEPRYNNATTASVTLGISSTGKATITVTLTGKPSMERAFITTYLEKKVGTSWERVDIGSTSNSWRFVTTDRYAQKTYTTTLSSRGQYRAVASFNLYGSENDSFTLYDTATY